MNPRTKTTLLFFAIALGMMFENVRETTADVGDQERVRRFAFIIGSNDGGSDRIPLRFAHTDAKAFARVIHQLGGVTSRNSIILLEPDRFDFEAALSRMRTQLERSQSQGVRVELIIYYSGHSDEQGLLLGQDLITYQELRAQITDLPADVRIAILDSCASGAMTRRKGGVRRAPFLVDASVDVKGYAYLTSASADEVAQESDRVGGSFFTHYLVSGLRGAADASRDSKVTLSEAYQYAFNETLARTESTSAGPQHANYDFQLKGSGDLVLTDLRGTSALLLFAENITGRIFIRNREGQLVAEINKAAGRKIEVGLDPGHYEVTIEEKGRVEGASVQLVHRGTAELGANGLQPVPLETTSARGGGGAEEASNSRSNGESRGEDGSGGDENTSTEEIAHRRFSISFVPGLTTDAGEKRKVRNNFSLNFVGWGDYLTGVELGWPGNIRLEDVKGIQLGGVFNFVRGDVRGLQAAGIFNFGGHALRGFQGAGIANVVHGPLRGFQGAGIANANTDGSATGFQGAGIANFNLSGVHGFQAAGIVNINATGHSQGVQFAAIGNYSQSCTGAQVSSIASVTSGEMRGIQIGLTNYAGVMNGVQVGLINIAREHNGVPIGLINAIGNGMLTLSLWSSDVSTVNIGLKMGSRHFYTLLGYGAYLADGEEQRWDALMVGLGAHFDFNPFWLEIELVSHFRHQKFHWSSSEYSILHQLRPMVGWRFVKEMSLFAGPAVGALLSETTDPVGFIPPLWTRRVDDLNLKLAVGFLVGMQWAPHFGKLNSHSSR